MKIRLLPSELQGDPEVTAMLQTLYSRSHQSIDTRLANIFDQESQSVNTDEVKNLRDKLEKYFVGMAHYPVGDNGSITIFFEDVSILCAKALQENPLYNGIECSTRYLLFSIDNIVTPTAYSIILNLMQKRWIALYDESIPLIKKALEIEYPLSEQTEISESTWGNAIKARTFDIARSLLPAGVKTSLSFHGSIRTFREHLSSLLCHELEEVATLSEEALRLLSHKYPSSFDRPKYNAEESTWLQYNSDKIHYNYTGVFLTTPADQDSDQSRAKRLSWKSRKAAMKIDTHLFDSLSEVRYITCARPKGVKFPFSLGRYATTKLSFYIDYGCGRDIQRHRNGKLPLPVLTPIHGFHPWYEEQLNKYCPHIMPVVNDLFAEACNLMESIPVSSLQYALPLGTVIPLEVIVALDELVYIAELRTQDTVHPILRGIAQEFAGELDNLGISHYCDMSPIDTFSLKRGTQTFNPDASDL